MRTFKDSEGREWVVRVHSTAIKDVRGAIGIDLRLVAENNCAMLAELSFNEEKLVDVVWQLVREQAEKLGVTDRDFGKAMWGDAIGAAHTAFLEELADFFRDPRIRKILRDLLTKAAAVQTKLLDRAEVSVTAIDADSVATSLIDKYMSSQES